MAGRQWPAYCTLGGGWALINGAYRVRCWCLSCTRHSSMPSHGVALMLILENAAGCR